MSKKFFTLLLSLLVLTGIYAQNSINDYKYMIVPLKFDFLKGKDKYRTSTLTRYLLKNEGFEVYFDEENLPEDLFNNRCLALYTNVNKIESFLKNKVQIEIKDCFGNQLFLSDIGESKIKEYDKAYPAAIRAAFESFKFLNYTYNPNANIGIVKANNNEEEARQAKEALRLEKEAQDKAKAEAEKLRQEVETLKKQKAEALAEMQKTKTSSTKKVEETKVVVPEEEKSVNIVVNQSEVKSAILYAQPIENGFQIVDTTPKVIMILLKTAAPNVYSVKGKDAIVFKDGEQWMYSEGTEKKELMIKF